LNVLQRSLVLNIKTGIYRFLKNNLPESKGFYDLADLLPEENGLVKAACEPVFIQ